MLRSLFSTGAAVALTLMLLPCHGHPGNPHLPIIDLGYELYEATTFNSTGGLYNFSNIRYAAAPTGENRFRGPLLPITNHSEVQPSNRPDRICPQANAAFLALLPEWIPLYLAGQTKFNQSEFNASTSLGQVPPQDPRTTEDCLFLDVTVPQKVFDNAGTKGRGAAVLVWIHGGSYSSGSKSSSGNPAGLIRRSQKTSDGVIFVSINYRLGAFGWLSGPTFQENGTPNAALYDQQFALQWVQHHISKFGGDPDRVTVMGESAGAGSIMHQITAHGGLKGPVPFKQAILQSPGFEPVVSNHQQEKTFQTYLSLLNVTTLAEARHVPFSIAQAANIEQIAGQSVGAFGFGPAVDGDFVPALPGELLLHCQFDKTVKIMVGHNANEGLIFSSPFVQNNTQFNTGVAGLVPTAQAYPDVLAYITDTLYPADLSGAAGYTNQIARSATLIGELLFACNTFYLNTAFRNQTFAYYFDIPPALHADDVAYTYYNGPSSGVKSSAIALALQDWITEFAETGSPGFEVYGGNATVQRLGVEGISPMKDLAASARCDWWQKAVYV